MNDLNTVLISMGRPTVGCAECAKKEAEIDALTKEIEIKDTSWQVASAMVEEMKGDIFNKNALIADMINRIKELEDELNSQLRDRNERLDKMTEISRSNVEFQIRVKELEAALEKYKTFWDSIDPATKIALNMEIEALKEKT